jgi:hypothetical protein
MISAVNNITCGVHVTLKSEWLSLSPHRPSWILYKAKVSPIVQKFEPKVSVLSCFRFVSLFGHGNFIDNC